MLLTLNIVKHEFDKIAPYLVMATKTASKHLKWAQVFQHVEHLWQFEGRSSKQRLNIWAQYILENIWLWLYFMESIWSPTTRCGARSLWQGRAGLGQTGHFLCQHPNIPLGAKPFRWTGKNCYITLWDQTSIVCFQRQIYLIEQIDQGSVLDKHVDKIFSWKKEMAQIMQSDTGWPKVDKLDEKIKLSQTHWQILLATFSHFPPN